MASRPGEYRHAAVTAFLCTIVAVATIVAVLAVWELRVLVALLFFGLIIAAAMRPGVESLARHRVPRAVGVLVHYLAFVLVVAVLLWFALPTALGQVRDAVGNVPTSRGELKTAVKNSTGVKHEILLAVERRLQEAPSLRDLLSPALNVTRTGLEILAGIFFVFAVGAYWIFERERVEGIVLPLLPGSKRRVVQQTWRLMDLKLGSYVRGVVFLVCSVSTVLSLAFWVIGLPYWLLLGVFAGLVEIIPIVGPLIAAIAVIGTGLTVSLHTAALAGGILFGLRLLQDYAINPKVLGHAIGLTPLTVLVSVTAVGLLLGPAMVPLATPLAAVIATLVDVVVRGRDPAKEEVPALIFPGQEVEPETTRKSA
ncbi:MAG TPA: AI-2E family transporter [Gaiellaceae bacterium]|nr:AI-2E family transporter [Gaiellaceae bacterium]